MFALWACLCVFVCLCVCTECLKDEMCHDVGPRVDEYGRQDVEHDERGHADVHHAERLAYDRRSLLMLLLAFCV